MTIVNPLFPWQPLLYVWFSDLYHCKKTFLVQQPIYTHRKIIKAPLLHQRLGSPCLFLFLSFSLPPSLSLSLPPSFQLILWSMETRWAHSLAWAFKTSSRRCPVPSWAAQALFKGVIGSLHKPENISFFLFHFIIVNSRPPGSGPLKDPNKWSQKQGPDIRGIADGVTQDLLRSGPIEVSKY